MTRHDLVVRPGNRPDNERRMGCASVSTRLHKLAAGSGIAFEVSEAAKDWLLAQNDRPEWGARPLRRILRRYLREPLADALLRQPPAAGTAILIDAGPAGLTFKPAGGG